MSTPARPQPPVDAAQLFEFRKASRSWQEIGIAFGLPAARCKAFYIQIVRSRANKARRSQQKHP